jgi:hypothetical protein
MKMRVTLLAAASAVAALVLAVPTLAKGPSAAKIDGPGLKGGGIHLKGGSGDPSSGTPLGDLTEFGGYFPATFGQEPDPMLAKRPQGSLGPKYMVEYEVPGPGGDTSTIHQDLYPYAKAGPVTYTPPGQSFFGDQKTHGGWFLAPSDLKTTLVAAGLPRSAPSGDSGSGWALSWGATTVLAALLVLLALMVAVLRRRPRPAEA